MKKRLFPGVSVSDTMEPQLTNYWRRNLIFSSYCAKLADEKPLILGMPVDPSWGRTIAHQAIVGIEYWLELPNSQKKSPGGESNTRSPDRIYPKLQSGALNQLGYREELLALYYSALRGDIIKLYFYDH